MSTSNLFWGVKGRLQLKAVNLTAICEPIFYKMFVLQRLMVIHGLLQG
jgi:hypothetical protein